MAGRIAEGWLDAVAKTQTLTPRQKTVAAVLHGAIVEQLDVGGRISNVELARRAGLERHAVARALEWIIKQGWAQRDAAEWWLVLRGDPPPPATRPGARTDVCPACEGDGWVDVAAPPGELVGGEDEQPWLAKCARCNGTGRLPVAELERIDVAELEPDPPPVDPDPPAGDDIPY